MAIQSDFMAAINQIAAERKIDPAEIVTAIKDAVLNNYNTQFDSPANARVELDEMSGKISVFATKNVVKEVTDEAIEVAYKDAVLLNKKVKVGDEIEVDATNSADFGRIAAQTARQVILQGIRESEKTAIMKEFEGKEGTIETGIIQRLDGDSVIIEIRKALAVMPAEDRIMGEFYKSANKIKVLVKGIVDTPKGKVLKVSRSDPDFLRALFTLEVPEIESGSVEIKAIAREAGSRSKVAVYSNTQGVDPIGSCVGQKGIRIMTITNELRFGKFEEKIDIILWDAKMETFVSNALSPAQTVSVKYDEAEKVAKVIVPDEQLSLAIGKDGQNVRLAAKLTGVKIDIEGETEKVETNQNAEGEAKPSEDVETPEKEEVAESTEEKTEE